MFLESNLGYRFRYKRKYIQPSLLDKSTSIIGRRGYIVHVNTSKNTGKKPDTIHEFLPIREATIKEMRSFGEFVWIYFEVGNWISYSQERSPNAYHNLVRQATPPQSSQALTLTMYEAPGLKLDTIRDDPSAQSVVTANWIRIVNQMARFPDHKSRLPTYLKMIAVRRKDCQNPIFPKAFSDTENGYEMSSDKDYRVEIFQYNEYGPPAKPFSLKIGVDENRITPVIDRAAIVGQYDFLALDIRPLPTLQSYEATLSFEVDLESDMKLDVRIPTRIKRGFGQIVGAIAIAAGFALATLAQVFAAGNTIYLVAGLSALMGFIGFYYWGKTSP
jgi:hypothetical protein